MCGISGILSLDGRVDGVSHACIEHMCAQIVHRGPDDDGYHVAFPVALGMRRLSIIDLETGRQPIFNEDGSICVVFNGEIYNFQSLREQLIKKGHRFSTNTDTEVIVHLYEEYGESFPLHLNGMFAIAVWDGAAARLILVRDRLGVKPLYYSQANGLLVFGSEIKCLLAHEAVSRQLDSQAVYDYFCLGYIPQPRSVFAAIRKLAPGEQMIVERGQLRRFCYWSPPHPENMLTDREAAKEQLRDLLADAVRIRMISEVPLGGFLSGGVDSSITVALMAQQSSQPVRTFFIDFEDSRYSERAYARAVAEMYGTEHHELTVRPDAVSALDALVHHFDEPFGDSSAIPTYYLSQMARRHVTVALAGDGGDESFGGYNRYLAILQRRELVAFRPLIGALGRAIHRLLPPRARGRRYFRSLGMTNIEFFAAGTQELEAREALTSDFLLDAPYSLLDEIKAHGGARGNGGNGTTDALTPYSRLDTQWYLPDDILTKVDRMSMAHSLEVRGPFLDYRVVELASQIPTCWKIGRGDTKLILKDAFRNDLPPKVLKPRKRGFSIPLADWLRGDLRPMLEDSLSDTRLSEEGILNLRVVRRWASEHMSGARSRAPQLWRFLFFARWYKLNQQSRAESMRS